MLKLKQNSTTIQSPTFHVDVSNEFIANSSTICKQPHDVYLMEFTPILWDRSLAVNLYTVSSYLLFYLLRSSTSMAISNTIL